jgi:hypothetical protein
MYLRYMYPLLPVLNVGRGVRDSDAAAWGPPTRAEPLMPMSALERRARMGETAREELALM